MDHSMWFRLLQVVGNDGLWWPQHSKVACKKCDKPSVDDLFKGRGTVLKRVGLSYDLLRFSPQLLDWFLRIPY